MIKILPIILILSCQCIQGQYSPMDTIFDFSNLHLKETINQDKSMRPYQIAAAGILISTFVVNWIVIDNEFREAPPGSYVNANHKTLPVYIVGVSLSAGVITTGLIQKNRKSTNVNQVYIPTH